MASPSAGRTRTDPGDETASETSQHLLVLGFAFPNGRRFVIKSPQIPNRAHIALLVASELRHPETAVALWYRRFRAPFVAMPEAPVNEDGPSCSPVRDVGRAGQVAVGHAAAQAELV